MIDVMAKGSIMLAAALAGLLVGSEYWCQDAAIFDGVILQCKAVWEGT